MCRGLVPALVLTALLPAGAASAADPPRSPIPEPIFSETVTDIDGIESGELEVSADAGELRSRHGGGILQVAGLEAEWLALSHLGLRLEPSIVHSGGAGLASSTDAGIGTTAAWKLVRDYEDDFYLQLEAGAEWPVRSEPFSPPDQPGLPLAVDARAAFRSGLLTLRGSIGAGAGGASPHVPLRASVAVLASFDPSSETGFFGIEALADGTWRTPVFAAPDVVADLTLLGLPARLGVALPWSPGADGVQPSLGVYVRLMVEPLRELPPASR